MVLKSLKKLNIIKFIDIPTFLISLSIGLFITYITGPEKHTIFVYPNPDNLDKIQYKDHTDTCYKFESKEVKCPDDKKQIRSYNVQ